MDHWSLGGKKNPEFTGPNVSTYDPSTGRQLHYGLQEKIPSPTLLLIFHHKFLFSSDH